MINIYEYIIGKNTKVVKNSDFKKQFETKEEVCEFFENKGFKKATYDAYSDGYNDIVAKFLNSHKPIYCIGKFEIADAGWWVRFGKGGKDEYIFFWNVKGTMANNYVVRDSNDELIEKFKTFEEFKEYTIKYFNW